MKGTGKRALQIGASVVITGAGFVGGWFLMGQVDDCCARPPSPQTVVEPEEQPTADDAWNDGSDGKERVDY